MISGGGASRPANASRDGSWSAADSTGRTPAAATRAEDSRLEQPSPQWKRCSPGARGGRNPASAASTSRPGRQSEPCSTTADVRGARAAGDSRWATLRRTSRRAAARRRRSGASPGDAPESVGGGGGRGPAAAMRPTIRRRPRSRQRRRPKTASSAATLSAAELARSQRRLGAVSSRGGEGRGFFSGGGSRGGAFRRRTRIWRWRRWRRTRRRWWWRRWRRTRALSRAGRRPRALIGTGATRRWSLEQRQCDAARDVVRVRAPMSTLINDATPGSCRCTPARRRREPILDEGARPRRHQQLESGVEVDADVERIVPVPPPASISEM